jgi:hypothetical protein
LNFARSAKRLEPDFRHDFDRAFASNIGRNRTSIAGVD